MLVLVQPKRRGRTRKRLAKMSKLIPSVTPGHHDDRLKNF
jgi:hypothetical protein